MATTRKTAQSKTAQSKTAQSKTAQSRTTKQTAGRTLAKRASPARSTQRDEASPHDANGQSAAKPKQSLRSIAIMAAKELSDLIGQDPESIVGVEKRDDGWLVQVQVVESRRVPATTDIMAVYEVEVDEDGEVTGYRRADRYVRGRIQE
ncbi:gas vesicle protein [Kribbella sp. NPDC048915]|uniref:gas vesicle protein GvpO n=1 Tax=Kribbella sp. NPDC048915 TaxID=3155148 RepID=UPI0033E4DEBD